jgi:hypothetical protein
VRPKGLCNEKLFLQVFTQNINWTIQAQYASDIINEHAGKTGGFKLGHSNSAHMQQERLFSHVFVFFSAVSVWNMNKYY